MDLEPLAAGLFKIFQAISKGPNQEYPSHHVQGRWEAKGRAGTALRWAGRGKMLC